MKIWTEEEWKEFIKEQPEFQKRCEEFLIDYLKRPRYPRKGYHIIKNVRVDGDIVDIYFSYESGNFDPVWVGQY